MDTKLTVHLEVRGGRATVVELGALGVDLEAATRVRQLGRVDARVVGRRGDERPRSDGTLLVAQLAALAGLGGLGHGNLLKGSDPPHERGVIGRVLYHILIKKSSEQQLY